MLLMILSPPVSTLFPYTTLFRSRATPGGSIVATRSLQKGVTLNVAFPCCAFYGTRQLVADRLRGKEMQQDRKSTRLNSSHQIISYAVFCLKKKIRSERYITIAHS